MSKQKIRPTGMEGISTPANIQQVAQSGKTPALSPSEVANALGRAAEALRRANALLVVIGEGISSGRVNVLSIPEIVDIALDLTGLEAESAQEWADLAEKSAGGGAA
ncbi:hypothetical protein CEY09_14645 [Achromobacter marplatensis]|uniref:Uncharacterized protein n=1 Tax=Achromobacter marplatensis TaxID=470868 RepID=A0ABX9GD72_9BURK|nr:hypothetical protein [Achromobacter marplatensis]OWT67739.1 hypothetical protein CEY09_14645 [Achromobacter marplatensis]RBP19791.1 hypothetical protein DFP87_104126 [Achromobacter marplatensis]CAB3637086.1 hypothetical protein LMG26219_01762 [Achromobacter marplatensis]